MTLAKKNSFA